MDKRRKDYYGSALLITLGAAVCVTAYGYQIGSLTRMGPGYFPWVLGILLMVCGISIGLTAGKIEEKNPHAGHGFELRSWAYILGGVLAFALLAEHAGFVPAAFACVFLSAMGDRQNSIKQAALLAAGMVLFGAIVFVYGLDLQLPLFFSW